MCGLEASTKKIGTLTEILTIFYVFIMSLNLLHIILKFEEHIVFIIGHL